MIQVTLFEVDGVLTGYEVTGHAGYAEHGSDIVCAAISMLAYTTLRSLHDVAGREDVRYSVDEDTGNMHVMLSGVDEKSRVILETLQVGVESTIEMYSDYIRLTKEEVQSDDTEA